MAISFKKQQYKDSTGKTPSDYLCELLEKDVDVIKLATYIQKIPNEGVLFGKPLSKLKNPSIGIWVYSQGEYHVIYSYFKNRNEVCFLDVFAGDPKARIPEAINRVKQFYNMK
jgi:hypothetical protein